MGERASKVVVVKLSRPTSPVCPAPTTRTTTVCRVLGSDAARKNPLSDGPSSSGSCSLPIYLCDHFLSTFPVPPLNVRFAVDDILPGFSDFLPAHVVPRLGSGKYYPRWKQGRAHHFHNCRLSWHRDLPIRLGGHPPQQSWFPRMVHLPVVDLLCLPRHPRLHHLQEAHVQLGRKAQQAVVADPQCWWPLVDPESARVLWILQSFRVGHGIPNVLCEEYSTRL